MPHPIERFYFISGFGGRCAAGLSKTSSWWGFGPIHIQWEDPHRGETLEHYAGRLLNQVTTEHPILVGLSFGGLVAVEMAKQSQPAQVVLLSSVSTAAEIPVYFKLFRWLPIHLILPLKRLLWAAYWLLFWLFDLGTQAERKSAAANFAGHRSPVYEVGHASGGDLAQMGRCLRI